LREYGCSGVVKKADARTGLDDLPGIHDTHAVRHAGDDAQVVGDQQQAHALAALDVAEQIEHLRLDGDVERRRRLVGDEHTRTPGQRHGDHHALLHASRKLEGKLLQPACRVRDAHRLEQTTGLVARRRAAQRVRGKRLDDLRAHAHDRVEAGRGLLKDHPDTPAAHPAHRRFGQAEQGFAGQADFAGDDATAIGQQARERERGHRLAATGFAQQGEGLAGVDLQIDAVYRPQRALAVADLHAEAVDLEQWSGSMINGDGGRRVHGRGRG